MAKIRLSILMILIVVFHFFGSFKPVASEVPHEEILEAVIEKIVEEKEITLMDKKQLFQKLQLLVIKGSLKDKKIWVENGNIPLGNVQRYSLNDKVTVNYSKDNKGKEVFYIKDYVRRSALIVLVLIFIFLTLIIAKFRGVTSFLGMGFSFVMIFGSILPNILSGANPVISVIIASIFIIPVTFYLSHGLNRKTTIAIVGTFIALIITGILAMIFVEATKLTGFSSEEASFLQIYKQGVNMKGILLAGIIIGAMGVLDDITIAQVSVVFQLENTDKKLTRGELYKRAMDVGKDHISSMINTLVLVYAGAALPLLLLFVQNPHSFSEIINYEMVAEEIVRTIVGSIGLITAVPITSYIASLFVKSKTRP